MAHTEVNDERIDKDCESGRTGFQKFVCVRMASATFVLLGIRSISGVCLTRMLEPQPWEDVQPAKNRRLGHQRRYKKTQKMPLGGGS